MITFYIVLLLNVTTHNKKDGMLGCNSRISGEVILFSTKTLCHMAQGITCYSVYLFYNDTLVSYNLFTHLAMNLN